MSATDWLANMAVDELAKSAAQSVRVPAQARSNLDLAQQIATYWRSLLGEATYKSQHHMVTKTRQDGTTYCERTRDSDGKPPGNVRTSHRDSDSEHNDNSSPTLELPMHADAPVATAAQLPAPAAPSTAVETTQQQDDPYEAHKLIEALEVSERRKALAQLRTIQGHTPNRSRETSLMRNVEFCSPEMSPRRPPAEQPLREGMHPRPACRAQRRSRPRCR